MPEVNGLIRVKPANVPSIGDSISLTAQIVKGKSGKPYTKFKRDTAEYGGVDCTVNSVKQLGDPDDYGNVMLALDVVGELEVVAEGATPTPQREDTPAGSERQNSIEAQTAVHIGAELVAAGKSDSLDDASHKAHALIQSLKGSADPKATSPQGGNDSSEGGTKPAADDDIPF